MGFDGCHGRALGCGEPSIKRARRSEDDRARVQGTLLQGSSAVTVNFQGHRVLLSIKKGSRMIPRALWSWRKVHSSGLGLPCSSGHAGAGANSLGRLPNPKEYFVCPYWSGASRAGFWRLAGAAWTEPSSNSISAAGNGSWSLQLLGKAARHAREKERDGR